MKQKEKIFLALTSLEEFWDKNKEIIFLGNWCIPYGHEFYEKKSDKSIISWRKEKYIFEESFNYVDEIYEKNLKIVSCKMNEIHKTNFSERYWRIILGPWLYMYTSVIYDRYMYLKTAINRYSSFDTIGLSENDYFIPSDTISFVEKLKSDKYNLQIFSEILKELDICFERKEINYLEEKTSKGNKRNVNVYNFLPKIINRVKNNFRIKAYRLFRKKAKLIMKESYFSSEIEWELFVKSKGEICPVIQKYYELPNVKINNIIRSQLLVEGENEFQRILYKMISRNIPMIFLEGFDMLNKEVKVQYKKFPKFIFSATSYWFDEVFKQYSALASEQGALLLGTQHGGNYGSEKYMNLNYHELKITDTFYSWGWNSEKYRAKVRIMPSTKLSNKKIIGANNKKNGILYLSTVEPMYLIAFYGLNNESMEKSYLDWGKKVIENLPVKIQNEVKIRPHRENLGWNYKERMKEKFKNIQIEEWNIPFLKSLEECRLYVCDHLSTTFLEALSLNKPTILIWDKEIYELNEEAIFYYEKLYEAGILFYSPEEGAKVIKRIYDDVETWWNNDKIQGVIKEFCENFALSSTDCIKMWEKEFNNYIKS